MAYNPNNGFKLKQIDLSDDTSIAATGTNTQTLTPPTGKIYQVVDIHYLAPDPAGSASGTHKLEVRNQAKTSTSASLKLRCEATTGNDVGIGFAFGLQGDSSEVPSAAADQRHAITEHLWCNSTLTLKFIYTNSTDVAQAGTRTLLVLVKEYNERG